MVWLDEMSMTRWKGYEPDRWPLRCGT